MYSYQILNQWTIVYGTCTLQTRCVRSTHARDTLSKLCGRQAFAKYVDVSSGNAQHKLCVS